MKAKVGITSLVVRSCLPRHPWEHRKVKLSEAVSLLSTGIRVFPERVCGATELELGTVHFGKRFLMYTLILLEY